MAGAQKDKDYVRKTPKSGGKTNYAPNEEEELPFQDESPLPTTHEAELVWDMQVLVLRGLVEYTLSGAQPPIEYFRCWLRD